MKHLNRDVELLTEDKPDKKLSTKKSSVQTVASTSTAPGKESSSK